ncbi:MAG: hypothetical protein AB2693_30465 [Candidatus Thiodiazotropha sp.]
MTSFSFLLGAPSGPSVSSRRSPRKTSRREPNFTKTESPLIKEKESESHSAKNAKSKSTKEDNLAEKLTNKNAQNNADGQEKHPRRSSRCKSPVATEKSFKPDVISLVKLESQISDKRKVKDTGCLNASIKILNNDKSDDVRHYPEVERELDVTQRSTEETEKITDKCKAVFQITANRSNKNNGRSSDSLQVRELKKLEDYWTRKSPVSEQSPRLRSSAKTSSSQTSDVVHQTLEHSKETVVSSPNRGEPNSNNLKPSDSENTDVSLPESPVPRRISQRLKINESNSTITKEIPFGIKSNKLITKDSRLLHDKNERIKSSFLHFSDDKENTCSRHTSNKSHQSKDLPDLGTGTKEHFKKDETADIKKQSPRRKINTRSLCPKAETENQDKEIYNFPQDLGNSRKNDKLSTYTPSHQERSKTNILSLTDAFTDISIKEYADSDSDDDDDYIPPRKKLRSEVTTDELWEGFPLTFSFKRLAPIQKEEQYNCSAKSEDTPSTSAAILNSNMAFEPKEGLIRQLRNYDKQENISATDKECQAIKPTVQNDQAESSYLENSLVVNADKQNQNIRKGQESQNDTGITVCIETTDNEVSLPSTDPTQKISSDCSQNSTNEKTKSAPKRKRYSISPNMTLKRSSRLQEKYGHTPEKSTCVNFTVLKPPNVSDNDHEQPQTSTKHISRNIPGPEVGKSTINTDSESNFDSGTTKDLDETNSDDMHVVHHEHDNYTQLKDDRKKDMSILEILTYDYSQQLSFTTINNTKTVSNNISCDKTCIENLDSELDEDDYTDSIVNTDNRSPYISNLEHQNHSATESVSYTLSELLAPNAGTTTENGMKNLYDDSVKKMPVSNDSVNTSPTENIIIIDREIPSDVLELKSTVKEHRASSDCKTTDVPYDSPTCSSINKTAKHAVVDVQKLTVPKDMQDAKFICSSSANTKTKLEEDLGSEKVRRKVPPLRIKLKPKTSLSKKKKSNKKTTKILVEASTTIATAHESILDDTNDAASPCKAGKDTESKNSTPGHTEKNTITQQENPEIKTNSEQKNKRPKKPFSKRRKRYVSVILIYVKIDFSHF